MTLDKDKCNQCPYKDKYKPEFYKKKSALLISLKSAERAKQQKYMKSEEFKEHAKFRDGVESLPYIIRRKYRVDNMPVRGKLRTKLSFGLKVAALNFQNWNKKNRPQKQSPKTQKHHKTLYILGFSIENPLLLIKLLYLVVIHSKLFC